RSQSWIDSAPFKELVQRTERSASARFGQVPRFGGSQGSHKPYNRRFLLSDRNDGPFLPPVSGGNGDDSVIGAEQCPVAALAELQKIYRKCDYHEMRCVSLQR